MRAILALLFLLGGLNAAHAQCAPPFNWSGFYPPAALVCDPGYECVWRTPAIRDGCADTCPTRRSSPA